MAAETVGEAAKLDARFNAGIHNRFDIEVIDSRTGEVRQRAQAENVICSKFWASTFGIGSALKNIAVGSGTGVPSEKDTDLFSFLTKKAPNTSEDVFVDDTENLVYSIKRKITLIETELVGSTLTEVGFHNETYITTHAMMQDMNGNQISILKTDTDIINIYATIFICYANIPWLIGNSHKANMLEISAGYSQFGQAYANSQFCRAYAVNVPGYSDEYGLSVTRNPEKKTMTIRFPRFPADYANGGGIYTVESWTYPVWTVLNFPINKLDLGSDIIGEVGETGDGTTKDFATDFAMASNITVYFNGVIQTTGIHTDPPKNTVERNIHFETPPPIGTVITFDYHTDYIAKDENHVFDLSITIELGEYMPTA